MCFLERFFSNKDIEEFLWILKTGTRRKRWTGNSNLLFVDCLFYWISLFICLLVSPFFICFALIIFFSFCITIKISKIFGKSYQLEGFAQSTKFVFSALSCHFLVIHFIISHFFNLFFNSIFRKMTDVEQSVSVTTEKLFYIALLYQKSFI